MTISCSCDFELDECNWAYIPKMNLTALSTKRGRRCCGCNKLIKVGESCQPLTRFRLARTEIEENIYGDEVPIATWYNCESCFDFYESITEQGYCVTLSDGWMGDAVEELKRVAEEGE